MARYPSYNALPTKALNGPRQQRGAMTLLISLVILTLITFVTLFTARTVTMEQKITGNSLQSRQAFEAAEAGMEAVVSYAAKDNGGIDRDGDNAADSNVFDADGLADAETAGTTNIDTLTDGSKVTLTVSGDPDQFSVTSVGENPDSSATRTIYQDLMLLDPVPNVPENPVTTRGALGVGGSASIYNPEGASTIWTGENAVGASTGTLKTAIADPGHTNYPKCLGGDERGDADLDYCDVIETTNGATAGLDVVENDSSLKNLSDDDFFRNVFGMSMSEFKATMVTKTINGADYNTLDGEHGEIIWVNGDATTNSGINVGCDGGNGNKVDYDDWFCDGSVSDRDSNLDPVIIIVDGNLTDSGSKYSGYVFVTGEITLTGSATIEGAVAAGGGVSSTGGSLDVWYSSKVLEAINDNGGVAPTTGTWRDFTN